MIRHRYAIIFEKFLLYQHMLIIIKLLILHTMSIVRTGVQTDFNLNHTYINNIVNRIAGFSVHATSCTLVLIVSKKRGEGYH